jgi:hypothetical protein
MQPRFEVADILRHTNTSQLHLSSQQQKTLRAITRCRTAALGGHIDACDKCGNMSISYNSCRNRHCPKCQGNKREQWICRREQDLLPCTYFHVVFTLPQQLNGLALGCPALVYNALFEAAWATINQFGKTAGTQMGMISILHTWGQNLSLHPHLHCIVPGGGVDEKERWQQQLRNNKYLFPVKALSKVFRAKYVAVLRSSGIADKPLLNSLFCNDWVVYAKRPFGGPRQVIEYLGRYTHKVAISNSRIKNVTDSDVTITYKDYKSGGENKTMTLQNLEFVRRFVQHILPYRFVRIRHYGILSSSWKRGKLQALQAALNVLRPEVVVKAISRKCPCCKIGNLVTVAMFGERGPPEKYILDKQMIPKA